MHLRPDAKAAWLGTIDQAWPDRQTVDSGTTVKVRKWKAQGIFDLLSSMIVALYGLIVWKVFSAWCSRPVDRHLDQYLWKRGDTIW
jgi:nitrate reductase NapE component